VDNKLTGIQADGLCLAVNHFIAISRGVFLKGMGIADLVEAVLAFW